MFLERVGGHKSSINSIFLCERAYTDQIPFHLVCSNNTISRAGDIYAVAFLVLGPPRTRRAQNGQTAVRARRRLLCRPGRSLCRGREIFGAAGGFGPATCGSARLTLLAGTLAHRLPDHPINVPPNSGANSSATSTTAGDRDRLHDRAAGPHLEARILFYSCAGLYG